MQVRSGLAQQREPFFLGVVHLPGGLARENEQIEDLPLLKPECEVSLPGYLSFLFFGSDSVTALKALVNFFLRC